MKILIIILTMFLTSCTNEPESFSYQSDSSSKSLQNQINVQIQNNILETPKITFQKEAYRNYLYITPLIENYDEKDFQFVWYVNGEKVSEEKMLIWERFDDDEIVCLLYSNHLDIIWSEKV